MRSIFDGFIKWIILLLVLGGGFVFVLKTFLNPPKASVPLPTNPPPTQSSQPPQTNKPTNPVQTSKSPVNNSNQPQSPATNSTQEPELVTTSKNNNNNNIPTTEQPEEYILEIPPKLEQGAELKVFVNNDNSDNPNPSNYSPSQIIKTKNINLSPQEEKDVFQESTSYFKVEETGEYNFLIGFDNNDRHYLDEGELVGKIDQSPLGNPRGGRVELDKGWHRLDLFYNPQFYARRIDENAITVKMGLPGKIAQTMEIWRAVDNSENQNQAQKQSKNSVGSN